MRYADIEYVKIFPRNSYKMPLDSAKPLCNPCNRYKRKKRRPEQGTALPPEADPPAAVFSPFRTQIYLSL